MYTYPSETNLVTSLLTSNPSCSITEAVGAADMASGLVVATLSTKSVSNTRAFD